MELADAAHLRGMEASLELPATILGTTQRKAPALPEPVPAPQPTVRTDPPVSSARPADNATAELAHDQPSKTAPPIKTAPPKEYVVQKKDTMTTIAEKYYGSSSPRFVDILVKSNQGRVKNANTVIEGQKLLIPNLPPEMFENAPGFDVSSQAPLASMDEMLNGARRAPKASVTPAGAAGTASGISAPPRGARPGTGVAASPAQGVKLNADPSRVPDLADLVPVLANPTAPKSTAKPSAAKDKAAKSSSASAPAAKDAKSEKPKSKDAKPDRAPRLAGDPSKALVDKDGQMYRWYEVKRNDTLANIARQELGSAERWNEIRKLNGAVDPKKIKPGERIRLPRKPQSTARESGRASA